MDYQIIKLSTLQAKKINKKLKDNNNYCPCALIKDETTKCMCKDFRDKIKDNTFFGTCHCGLYKKIKC